MRKGIWMGCLAVVLLSACQPKDKATTSAVDTEHVAKTSLDYQQTYKGKLPHFQGEVVEGTLQLVSDTNYSIRFGEPYAAVVSGSYQWVDGNTIAIENIAALFKIEEGRIRVLPQSGSALANGKAEEILLAQPIVKNADLFQGTLIGPEWYITEFDGKKVQPFERGRAFLQFTEDGRIGIFAGCNRMNGTYEVQENQLSISKIISTMMACPDMQLENAMGKQMEGTFQFELNKQQLQLKQNENVVLKAILE